MARKSLAEILGGKTRFGRLTVIADAGMTGKSRRLVSCKCACGKNHVTRADGLRRGATVSCGCASTERAKTLAAETCRTHGDAPAAGLAPEYVTYRSMVARCTRPTAQRFPRYGGRGIKVCDHWLGVDGYRNFLADMGRRPGPKFSIERENNDGHYELGNCRWATKSEQARNNSANRFVSLNGRRMALVAAAALVGLTPETIAKRIRRGWSEEDALARPSAAKK